MKNYDLHKITEQEQGLTVEAYLKQILQYSGRKIQKLTRQKGILKNGKSVYLQSKVKAGDSLKILIQEDTGFGAVPEPGTVDILYEDEFLIVVNKPAGLLVHPTGQTTSGTLSNYLAYHFERQGKIMTIRPLHRLDRDTTGCVLFAKDARIQRILEKQLQDNHLKRRYHAFVEGVPDPPAGTIEAPIGRHPSQANRRAVQAKGDPAVTHYRTRESFAEATLAELSLETGRTHQIRVHMAYFGHPVVGDRMYGKRSPLIKRQALHAAALSFLHPVDGRRIEVVAPLPPDFEQLLQLWRKR